MHKAPTGGTSYWLGMAALACGLLLTSPPTAGEGGTTAAIDYASFNEAVVARHVLPRYAAFAEAAAALQASLANSCSDGRIDEGESTAEFHLAMDTWMAVQHLRFGPSEFSLRTERLEFWPDKRGTVRRHLAQILSDRDPSALEAQDFANGSVAVQGFPALERLLFDSDETVRATPFGCRLIIAIGNNLNAIAAGLSSDWREGASAYAGVISGAAAGNETYFDAKEASLEFAKSLRGALLLVADYKLDRPLGANAEAARTARAESWRSARSLRNVAINLRAAEALYRGSGGGGFSALLRGQEHGVELDKKILAAFSRLVAASEALPESFDASLARSGGWRQLDAIRQETRRLLGLLGGPFSQVLDLPVGFNSYDGD